MTNEPAETPAMPPPPGPPPPPPPVRGPVPDAPALGWVQPAGRRPTSRRRWVIGCAILLVVLVIGVGACTLLLGRSFVAAGSVVAASNGQIDGFNVRTINGVTSITFTAARGVDSTEGPVLGCTVIAPTLAGTDLAGARWVLVNRAGDVIASSDDTLCQ